MQFSICRLLLVVSFLVQFNSPWASAANSEVSQSSHFLDQTLKSDPTRQRRPILPVFASLFLPGFDQWWERQYAEASLLSGMALTGLEIASSAHYDGSRQNGLSIRDDQIRTVLFGQQLYMASGSYSAFYSLRSALTSMQGEYYSFLKNSEGGKETLRDVWAAPFEFHFIKNGTSWVPLGFAALLSAVVISSTETGTGSSPYRLSDFAFSSSTSYLAGTHEEAFFRGTLFPMVRQETGNVWLANLSTSLVFGALHYSAANPLPIAQTAAGIYFAFLTQQRDWSIREAIFIHTWWDFILLNAQAISLAKSGKDAQFVLPTLNWAF